MDIQIKFSRLLKDAVDIFKYGQCIHKYIVYLKTFAQSKPQNNIRTGGFMLFTVLLHSICSLSLSLFHSLRILFYRNQKKTPTKMRSGTIKRVARCTRVNGLIKSSFYKFLWVSYVLYDFYSLSMHNQLLLNERRKNRIQNICFV